MTHDPLCEWSTPCIHGENQQHSRDTENLAVPDATYCWMCGADCTCDLIATVREDMLAKCIAVIEAMPTICDDLDWPYLDLTVPEIISEIKAEKP